MYVFYVQSLWVFTDFCVTCDAVTHVDFCIHISLFSTIFSLFSFLFVLCFAIVSHCPYYSSSHASTKVREGSNYWGPLGYEALKSPESYQSPGPCTASKQERIFKFRKRKDSKIPLFQGQKRWDFVICVCRDTICRQFLGGLEAFRRRLFIYVFTCFFHSVLDADERLHKLNLCRVSAGLKRVGVILVGQTGWAQWRWTRRNASRTSRSGCAWYWKTIL